MRKVYVLIFVLASFILSFAQQSNSFITDKYVDYQIYIKKLDNNIDNLDKAAAKFKEIFQNATIKERDYAFKLFFDKYQDMVFALSDYNITRKTFPNCNFQKIASLLKSNKFLSQKESGLNKQNYACYSKMKKYSIAVYVDYENTILFNICDAHFIKDNFEGFISQELYYYFSTYIFDNYTLNFDSVSGGEASASDLNTLADVLVTWESLYEADLPDYARQNAKEYFISTFSTLLVGLEDPGIIPFEDMENSRISDDFYNAYYHLINKYPSSVAAAAFKEYLNVLESNYLMNTEIVNNYIKKLEEESKYLLK